MQNLKLIFVLLFTFFLFSDISAQSKVRVRFAGGATSATVKGKIAGYKYIDYIVGAKGGQTMSVLLKSAHSGCSFVIFYSNMENVEDATDVTEFTRKLVVDDNYVVRVLLPRSAARRKESAGFSLKFRID
jgi:hypothetical protein